MDAASNKRVSVGVAWAASPVSSARKRQAFADVNSWQDAAEEFDGVIAELRNDNLSFREQLAKESSEKLVRYLDPDCHLWENQGRIVAEKLKAFLLEDLEKCKQEILAVDPQIASPKDLYKRLQKYNTSAQQYIRKLQTYLSDSNECLKRVENEKLSIVETLGALRRDHTTLQEQLALCTTLGDEAIKQRESFAAEVKCLREEPQQVREDRDNPRAQLQAISDDVLKYPESMGKSQDAACLENATVEFTKEEVEALLNYMPKLMKFDHKANAKLLSENNKRLRLCVKWFQTVEETHLKTEIHMAKRLEELDGVNAGLRNCFLFLREQFPKELSEKPVRYLEPESSVVAITDAKSLAQEYLRFINNASKEELRRLKGIGEKRASCILRLREMSPEPFKQLDDLQNIGLSLKQVLNLLAYSHVKLDSRDFVCCSL